MDRLGWDSAPLPSDSASLLDSWSDCNCWFVFTSFSPSSSLALVSGSRSVSVSGGSLSVVMSLPSFSSALVSGSRSVLVSGGSSLGLIALTQFGRKLILLSMFALSSSSSIFSAGSGWGINGWTRSSASRWTLHKA